jgi:hypothetical protein
MSIPWRASRIALHAIACACASGETLKQRPTNYTLKGMSRTGPIAPQLNLTFEEPQPTRRIWPVRELVGQVRELVELKYGDVWVEGEISNFRPAPSGHIYFTLKDADAQLPVVLFRRQAMLLRFRPEDGLHVLVRGRVSVYEQRGQMQLVAESWPSSSSRSASRPKISSAPPASAHCPHFRLPWASSLRLPAP